MHDLRFSLVSILTGACSIAGFSNVATGASFDCSRATYTAEVLVCQNPELSALDDRLAALYSSVRLESSNPRQLVLDERAWIAHRNACQTIECIANAYKTRLSELAGPTEPVSTGSSMGVPLVPRGGVLAVPVSINNAITLDFILDSGAADVVIPADVAMTLVRTGTVTDSDFLGQQTYVLADGTSVPSQTFRIRSLKVGNRILENVTASISDPRGDLLLGQSFLSNFQSWSIDNSRRVLTLQ